MFRINIITDMGDRITIYDDRLIDDSLILINPKLDMSENQSGSLTFKITPKSSGYSQIVRGKTRIEVLRDEEFLWEGRVIKDDEDFWKNRTIYCEGELSYLNDIAQRPAEYHFYTIRQFTQAILDVYNVTKGEEPTFHIGEFMISDDDVPEYRYTNYETTWDILKEQIIDKYEVHIRIRHEEESGLTKRYIDFLSAYEDGNTQRIEFGSNLLDYTKSFDLTDIATVVIPLGDPLDQQIYEGVDNYLNISEVNDGKIYIKNDTTVNTLGWIEKVVHFDGETKPTPLMRKGQKYLRETQYEKMVLNVKALDLHYLDSSVEAFDLLDEVEVVSLVHGLDASFYITRVSIPIDNPANTEYTLERTETSKSFATTNPKTFTSYMISDQKVTGGKVTKINGVADKAVDEAKNAKTIANSAYSEVTQYSNKIVMKVKTSATSDKMVLCQLGIDPNAQGAQVTEFKVKADNINLSASDVINLMSGGTINLNAGNGIIITSPGFKVARNGSIESISGTIGKFTINSNFLYSEYSHNDDKYRLVLRAIDDGDDETRSAIYIARSTDNGENWTYPLRMRYNGQIVANDLLCTGGVIGGWDISNTELYKEYTTQQGGTYRSSLKPSVLNMEAADNLNTLRTTVSGSGMKGYIETSGGNTITNWSINTALGIFDGFRFTGDEFIGTSSSTAKFGKLDIKPGSNNGGIDIFGSASPYIDFHIGLSDQTDHTYRLIHRVTDTIDFVGHNGATWGIIRAAQFSVQSSKYVKENINDISEEEAKKILDLRPVSFDYINGGHNQRGLIAEEVLDIYPEMVTIPEGYEKFDKNRPWNTPSIDYSKFVPALIKLVQMQQKEIDILKEATKHG